MENQTNRDYSQEDRNPQDKQSQEFYPRQDSELSTDETQHRNPEVGGAPAAYPDSITDTSHENKNFDGVVADNDLIPNPDDFDEGDFDGSSEDNERDATRTPGL